MGVGGGWLSGSEEGWQVSGTEWRWVSEIGVGLGEKQISKTGEGHSVEG